MEVFNNAKTYTMEKDLITQPGKTRRINAATTYNSFEEMQQKLGKKDNAFMVVDSSEIDFSLSMIPAKTDDVALVFVDKGTLALMHELNTYTLSEGMLLIKAPNVIARLISLNANSHFKVLVFTPRFASAPGVPVKHLETIALAASKNPVITLDAVSAAMVDTLFSMLKGKAGLQEKPELYNETIEHAFSLLILELASFIKTKSIESPTTLGRKEYLTFQFLKLSGRHIREHRSVNFYAEMLYVTPKYLSMVVKEVTGKTCGELIDEMVVKEAKVLLDNPEVSIAHVADELNFSDQFFFSKYFKKQTGKSPLHYRMAV